MSLKNQLYNLIKTKSVASLSELHELAHLNGRKESNAERRLRELTQEGLISPIFRNGNIGFYKLSDKMPSEQKNINDNANHVNDRKTAVISVYDLTGAYSELLSLENKVKELFKKATFGNKDYLDAFSIFNQYKKQNKTEDKIRLLNQVIYILSK